MTEETPVDRRKLSTIPSWVMLGFVLGALAALGYRSEPAEHVPADAPPEPPPAATPATEANTSAIADQPSFTVVDALFEQYRQYAHWEDDRTEIAIWNTRTLGFTDCFEVLRTEDATFYRPIPELTRLPLDNYGPPDSPLKFTESRAQRAARYEKAFGRPAPPAPPPPVELPSLRPGGSAPP